jgi:hypothetical protein
MLSCLQHLDIVSNPNIALLQRRDHHSQTGRLAALVDDAILSQRRARLIGIELSSQRVHIGEFAARSTARDVQIERRRAVRSSDTGFSPVVLVEGGWAGDVDVCAEAKSVKRGVLEMEGLGLARHLGGHVMHRGEVHNGDGVLRDR